MSPTEQTAVRAREPEGRPGPAPVRVDPSAAAELFRREAYEDYARGDGGRGGVLRASSAATRWTYRLVLGGALALVLFGVLGRIDEYAYGPALIRLAGRVEATATTSGTVRTVEVARGDRVETDEVLARYHGAQEEAELRRLERIFEERLRSYLRKPGDPAAEAALADARGRVELAAARVDELSLRAPVAGRVEDLWIRPGQHVTPGQPMVSLATSTEPDGGEAGSAGDGPGGEVVALLPGHFRPQLAPGMELRLELRGYPYLYQSLTVSSVGDDVIGPAEARHYLGPGAEEALILPGPVVVVHARLPRATFRTGDRVLTLHDGMQGRVELAVRSRPILVSLIPALEPLFGGGDD